MGIVRTMWQKLFWEDAVVSVVYIGLFAGRRWSVRMKWLTNAPSKNSLLGSDWQALCISSGSQGSTPAMQSHLWLSKRVCSCVSLRVRNLNVLWCAILFQEDTARTVMTGFYCLRYIVEKDWRWCTASNQQGTFKAGKKNDRNKHHYFFRSSLFS